MTYNHVENFSCTHIMIHLGGNEGGGIRTVVEAWHQGFCQRGVRVSYLVHGDGDYARRLKKEGREVYTVRIGPVRSRSWSLFGVRLPDIVGWGMSLASVVHSTSAIAEVLNKVKPDAVLGNGSSSAALIGPACKRNGTKLITCFHGVSHANDFLSLRKRTIAALANRYCRRVVGVSRETVQGFSPFLRIPPHVIYNSVAEVVTDESARIAFRNRFNIPENAIVFGSASRITPAKAIHLFIDAAEIFVRNHPDVSTLFLIAGEPRLKSDEVYLDQLLNRILKKGLKDKIKFVGHQPIGDFYSAIDVFCHTHEDFEPLGLTVVEALSAGLPIIIGDKGGFHEFLPHDLGVRYIGSSHEDLFRAIEKMIEASFRKEQSSKGKHFFTHEYISYSQWVDSWIEQFVF